MIQLTDSDIKSLNISPSTCLEWIKESFAIKPFCQLPAKVSLHPHGNDFINTMPCLLPPPHNLFGCKIVSRNAGQHPALKSNILVTDSSTGKLVALLQADWITSARTAAVATLAALTLRNSNASVYSFIGLGQVGQATLISLLPHINRHGVTIRLKRYKDHAETTISRLADLAPLVKFQIVDTNEALVDGADVVISAITDAKDLIVRETSLFKPGVLVIPIHTRGFQNCDTTFDRIIADDTDHVKDFRHFNNFKYFAELSDVLSNKAVGRLNDNERILSYNIGLGLHDILFAEKILQLNDRLHHL